MAVAYLWGVVHSGGDFCLVVLFFEHMKFKRLAKYFSELEKTASRNEMTVILARLIAEASPEEVDKICYLSLGRLAPQYAGIEFNLAEKLMIRAVALAVGLPEAEVSREDKTIGDLGEVIYNLKFKIENLKTSIPSVSEVYQRLLAIAQDSGAGSVERKISQMGRLLAVVDTLSAKYIARIPLGKLRMGFSDLTILDALSMLVAGDKSKRVEIEAAFSVRADIGQIAKTTKLKGLRGLKGLRVQLGVPVIPALCQRLPSPEEMIKKMCRPEVEHPRADQGSATGGEVAVEPKYDGTRLQVHFGKIQIPKSKVQIFTRNLENVTVMFPDVARAVAVEVKAKEVILDGEAIGFDPKTGKFLPFQETIKRKRKYEIGQTAKDIPLKYFTFDILYKDGQDLLAVPFAKRRRLLEQTITKTGGTIVLSPQIVTTSADELRQYHGRQISKGLEGVVVKKWQAPYEPGRRGFTWVKLKSELTKKGGGLADTLDCLVMGYYQGRGKRTGFGVGAFLVGVRQGDKFVTLSKIGTGLTDDQWRELKVKSEKLKVKSQPKEYRADKNLAPDIWCRPGLVVEIQADNITLSPIHSAGLALRFPRLVRFRDDKSAEQTTTLSETRKLYQLQWTV